MANSLWWLALFDALSTLDIKFVTKNSSSCLWKTFLFSWNWNTLKSRTWKYRANSLHAAITFCFGLRSVDWMLGFLVAAITFLLFRWLLPFHFTALHCNVLTEAFLLDLTGHFFCCNHYSMVFDCDCKSSREFNLLFLLRAQCGQNVPWLSMCKSVWGFFDFPNTSFMRSHVTKIGKYSICQLQNRFSWQPIGISKKPQTIL